MACLCETATGESGSESDESESVIVPSRALRSNCVGLRDVERVLFVSLSRGPIVGVMTGASGIELPVAVSTSS